MEINRQHPAASVVVIASVAVLTRGERPTMIVQWAAFKEGVLAFVLPAADARGPCRDFFCHVSPAIRPEAFQTCFAAWVRSLRDVAGMERPTLAIDGKTLRRSHDRKNGLGALHSVTVWASEYSPSLGQLACAEKRSPTRSRRSPSC